MYASTYLKQIVNKQKRNLPVGIFSICSAHPFVIKTSFNFAKQHDIPILIETTCNQVNQFGGYTNMKPNDFFNFVFELADSINLPVDQVFLGGDHLGPSVWKNEPVESAMDKSYDLIRHYIRAGYRKIHLDASMACKGDPLPLPKELIVQREALLCKAAVDECEKIGLDISEVVFVVGSEVPTPGGASVEEETLSVSDVAETRENISLTKETFIAMGLEEAWNQTIAFVVQPGVEFSDDNIYNYSRPEAKGLSKMIEDFDNLVFEAHSTDYQSRENLKNLVEDHFAILKVGPGLTFAFREGLFALTDIEKEIYPNFDQVKRSNLKEVLEEKMIEKPEYWKNHYSNNRDKSRFQRKYSFSDRSRYYWANSEIILAYNKLIDNLSSIPIPYSLVSQYFPDQVKKFTAKQFQIQPLDLIQGKIVDVLLDYATACQQISFSNVLNK